MKTIRKGQQYKCKQDIFYVNNYELISENGTQKLDGYLSETEIKAAIIELKKVLLYPQVKAGEILTVVYAENYYGDYLSKDGDTIRPDEDGEINCVEFDGEKIFMNFPFFKFFEEV